MKEHYAVTIGIPVYRSLDYIQDTMDSALNQTFLDIEFLIVDDCGNDGTMDVIKEFQMSHPRGKDIRIIVNYTNQGVSYSRNRIIDEAKGDFLYFMDSDDTIESNAIELLYDALLENQAQIAYGSYDIIDGIGDSPKEVYQKDSLVLKGIDKLALYAFKNNHKFHVSVCNHLINLTFLRKIGIRFLKISYWEDMVYTTELVTSVESAVLLSNITYHYLRRPGSLSNYQNRDVYDKGEVLKNASVLKLLKDKCPEFVGKEYIPYYCYNLEMNSFYVVCHVLRYINCITPKMTEYEMRIIMCHPYSLKDILLFKHKKIANIGFAIMSNLPNRVFILVLRMLGKIKKVL